MVTFEQEGDLMVLRFAAGYLFEAEEALAQIRAYHGGIAASKQAYNDRIGSLAAEVSRLVAERDQKFLRR